MLQNKMDVRVNGTKEHAPIKDYSRPVRLWNKLEMNEWTFCLSAFVLSLSIVLGKLYVDYGTLDMFGVPRVPNLSNVNVKRLVDATEKFATVSNHYENVLANAAMMFLETYGWLIKAAISGMIMTGYSWYIIYMDSRIPGIDPPSPFSTSRRRLFRYPGEPKMQINYLVGSLLGILVFVHMCW